MDYWILGVYWRNRSMTLREYTDFVSGLFGVLQASHPIFSEVQWVGDGKRPAVPVAPDLSNLKDLISRFSWQKRDVRADLNPNGTLKWEAVNPIGYGMIFDTGKSAPQGGVSLGIHSGDPEGWTPGCVTFSFPRPDVAAFRPRDFFEYDFLLRIFVQVIRYTLPERGLVTSHEFTELVYQDAVPSSGWLTYYANQEYLQLSREFPTEPVPVAGILVSLSETFSLSEEVIARALRLKERLSAISRLVAK